MPDINITFAEVRAKATELRTQNNTLTETLGTIKQKIAALSNVWTSDASDTIISKINGMQGRFDTYNAVIESYAKFLDDTANQYEQTESALNSNASQFI